MPTASVATAAGPSFSLNPIDDLQQMLHYSFMRNALAAGTAVGIVAGVVGYFMVLRSLAFAGHALSHIGFAGGAGAVLLGVSPILGLLAFTTASGAAMGALGRRIYGRDVAVGIVLAFALGLGSLFIRLYRGNSVNAYSILFGEIFGISGTDVIVSVLAGVATLAVIAVLYRPLLYASLDPEAAEARGVRVGALAIAFMVVLALAVSEAVQVVGVLLVFALLVSPPAIAGRLTHRPGLALLVAAGLALLFTWAGLVIAFYVPYPVSFFITTIAFASYMTTIGAQGLRGRRRGREALAQPVA